VIGHKHRLAQMKLSDPPQIFIRSADAGPSGAWRPRRTEFFNHWQVSATFRVVCLGSPRTGRSGGTEAAVCGHKIAMVTRELVLVDVEGGSGGRFTPRDVGLTHIA